MADPNAVPSENPFDQMTPSSVMAAAQAKQPPQPAAEPNYFDSLGPEVTGRTSDEGSESDTSATGTLIRSGERGIIPSVGGYAGASAGAEAGAGVGAAIGSVVPVLGTAAGGFVGGLAGGLIGGFGGSYVADKAQDIALSKAPDSWKEAIGQDDRQQKLDQKFHPTASFLGGIAPYAITLRPGLPGAGVLGANPTTLQKVLAYPATKALFGGAMMGGIELGQEEAQGNVDWRNVAISTGMGLFFHGPNRLGQLIEAPAARFGRAITGQAPIAPEATAAVATAPEAPASPMVSTEPAAPLPPVDENAPPLSSPRLLDEQRALWRQENPTVAMAADAGVMGPGITNYVHTGAHVQDPTAQMTAQETARTEASLEPQPPADVNAVARQMHPELYERYDDIQSRIANFKKVIDAGNNPPPEAFAELDTQRGTLQAQLDALGTYQSGPEARRIKAQIRDIQGQAAALQERRDAFAEGRAVDTPEMAQARQHLSATNSELFDLFPEMAAARRRAADYAGTPVIEPEQPALETPPVAGEPRFNSLAEMLAVRETPASGTPLPPVEADVGIHTTEPVAKEAIPLPPNSAHERDLIAADATKRYLAAGRPQDEAEALGQIRAAAAVTRAARFRGALGSAADIYNATASAIGGPKGPALAPEGAAKPIAPVAPPKPVVEPPAPRELSLTEFLAQAGGLKSHPELKAIYDKSNPFVPGSGRLIRKKTGMGLDAALRAATDAGYFHDTGEARGAGPLQNDTNTLLEALSKEAGGNKQYRLGAAVRNVDDGAETHAIASRLLGEMDAHGIDPNNVDSETMNRTIERLRSGQDKDPLVAYEKAVMEGTDQNEEIHKKRLAETGEIPGWDVPAEPGGTRQGSEESAGGGNATSGEATRNALRGDHEENGAGLTKGLSAVTLPSGRSVEFGNGEATIRAPNGERLGHVLINGDTSILQVESAARRKGVATDLYNAIEQRLGRKLAPSSILEGDGYAFWKARDPDAVKDYTFMPEDNAYVSREFLEEEKGSPEQVYPDVDLSSDMGNLLSEHEFDPYEMFQGARGSINFRGNQRPVTTLFKDANASTAIHEMGHEFLAQMLKDSEHPQAPDQLKDDSQSIRDWLKMNVGDKPKTSQHERFATGFEQYMREGVAPSPGLVSAFSKFKDWLTTIYQTLRGLGKPISDDIRQVFDRMLSTDPQRTVIAPEEPRGPTLADVHETDAAMTEPQNAEPMADRVASERARYLAEPHPEVKNEIAATEAKHEAERAAAAGGTDAGTENVGGTGGSSQVVPDSSGSESKSEGGVVGAGGGAVGGGGSGAAKESGAVSGTGSTNGRGPNADLGSQQFAPTGATILPDREPSTSVDKAANIRLDNVNTLEGVKQLMRDVAAANNDFIGNRQGKMSDGQRLNLSQALIGRDPDFYLAKKIGDAYNAIEATAIQDIAAKSATDTHAAMLKAANGTDEDVIAYAQAKARHQLIQGAYSQATAEAGRALRALQKIQQMWTPEASTADQFLRDATGETLFQLKMEAKMGASLDSVQKISKFMQDAQNHSFGRMLLEYYINALISGPVTHVTYGVGNTALAANRMLLETPASAAFGAAMRAFGRTGDDGVRLSEVAGQFQGLRTGYAPALNATIDSYRTGATTMLPGEVGQPNLPFQQNEFARPAELNQAATFKDVANNLSGTLAGIKNGIITAGSLLRAGGVEGAPRFSADYSSGGEIPNLQVNGVTALPLGDILRFPGRNVAAIHSFFRATNYSMEIAGQAFRQASVEGLSGIDHDQRVAELLANPTPAMMEAARSTATDLTLMSQAGPFVQKLTQFLNVEMNIPGLGLTRPLRFIDPFVNIAANVFNQSLLQRTPVGLLSPEVRADLLGKNGNAAQDLAAGKMIVGTALSLTFGGLAAGGFVTGSEPTDQKEAMMWRQTGMQAHSMRIGDMWYDVHRLGPLGMLMGVAADMHDVSHLASNGDMLKAAASLQHAFTQNMLDESFMRGPADLIQAIEDPGRYGENYLKNFVSSFVPYSVGMAQMARAADPYSRQARSVMDEIKAKIPGLSQTLLPRRDIWGEPMVNKTALGTSAVTAIYEQQISRDPVNQAMLALGVYPAQVERRIRNVPLTDEQYDEYSQYAGRLAKSRLDAIVRSPDFQTWPDHAKHDVMSEVINQSREAARGMMMGKYPSIPRAATQAKLAKMNGPSDE